MDAGGWVMDAGTRPISRVGRREVRCGNTRCLLRQGKTSVVARHKGGGLRPPPQRGGGRLRRPPPLCGSLVSCHHRGLALPQQTSCVATAHLSSPHTRDPYPHACAPPPAPKMCGQRPRVLTRAPPRPRPKCAIRDFSRRQSGSQSVSQSVRRGGDGTKPGFAGKHFFCFFGPFLSFFGLF